MEMDVLNETITKVDKIVEQINEHIVALVLVLDGKKITAIAQDHIRTYALRYKDYIKSKETNAGFDEIMQRASAIVTYSISIANSLKKNPAPFDSSIQDKLSRITNLSNSLKNNLEEREVTLGDIDLFSEFKQSSSKKYISKTSEDMESLIQSYKKLLNDAEDRHLKKEAALSSKLEELSNKIEKIEAKAQEKIEAVDLLFSDSQSQLEEKQNSIDGLLGAISGEIKSGDYAANAVEEKQLADRLRVASLVCMTIIAIVIGFSLYETTTDAFKWENSSFRLIFTILVSVPAAYLARESAKHRQQQYMHLQTSLDLKAIDPYLASLPIEEQHRIKSEMSNRLFATKSFASTGVDPYPINVQDILVKVIDKFDFKDNKK